MAITLPLPLRVAAGILATGIDRVRALPNDIPALPVSLIGNAMRLSMKVQQEIAELATRGDELLGGVIGAPQENPTWARFDDDEPSPPPARPRPSSTGRTTTASGPDRVRDRAPSATPGEPADNGHRLKTPETTSLDPETTTAMAAAVEVPPAVIEQALVAADDLEVAVEEAEAVLAEAVLEDAVLAVAVEEQAALEQAALEEAALQEAAEQDALEEAVLEDAIADAAEEAALEDAIEDAAEEAALEAVLERAADQAVEEVLEDAAEEIALELTLEEISAEESVLEQALVEAAVQEVALEDRFDQVVRQHAAEEAALEQAIVETVQAEQVLEHALEETLDEEAAVEEAIVETVQDELVLEQTLAETLDEEAELAAALDDSLDAVGDTPAGGDAHLPLAGYDRLTLAQVRGHLRDLSADDVAVLLQYERDTENRPPFLTLLSNRLVTLDAQNP